MELLCNEARWRCCCGIHYHTAALIIAIFEMLLYFFVNILMYFDFAQERHSTVPYLIAASIYCVISFLPTVSLIIGNRLRNPSLYWPYILTHAVMISVGLQILLVYFFVLLNNYLFWVRDPENRDMELTVIMFVFGILIYCTGLLVFVFFVYAVEKARRFLTFKFEPIPE